MTTLPPLSPVASNSPSWLNSTHEMMSAVDEQKLEQIGDRRMKNIHILIQWAKYFQQKQFRGVILILVERVGKDGWSCLGLAF